MRIDILQVGMGEFKITQSPMILTTLGLGSCVGLALYDTNKNLAGLAHIMLPDSTQISNNEIKGRFADTAIPMMIYEMEKLGCSQKKMFAKIAGGAQMFRFESNLDIMKIGSRNVLATKKILAQFRIPIISEDTGSSFGRTIEVYPDSGKLLVKAIGKGEKFI